MIGHCDALGTLSALGPWLEDLLLLLLTPRATWRLLLLLLGDRVGGLELVDEVDDDAGVAVPGQVDGVCRCPL